MKKNGEVVNHPRQYRQGDVWIEEVPDSTPVGKVVPREAGRVVLAHGEITNHSHAIAARTARLYDKPESETERTRAEIMGDRILCASTAVKLQHEEHSTITIPKGTSPQHHRQDRVG